MARVHIRELDIRLGGQSIIENLNLAVEDGEFLVLLGPSGCGKSTLLHSIAGLIDITDGQLDIGDQDVTWADPKDRGIGMVFQSYALYPTMTVERNLSFGLRISGIDRSVIAARVERAARMLQLEPLLGRKPAQLSGGQRQRVAIGRALVREAGVYLFDEPLSNLDARLRGELRRELKQLHREIGATMIYVTHDQVEAMTLATRIAVMRGGVIQQIATPADIYARPVNMFVAGFLGAPGMNFVEGTLEVGSEGLVFRAPALTLPVTDYPFHTAPQAGQRCVLGVRPEAVRLVAPQDNAAGLARVSMVEPMGAHQIVWLDAQGRSLAVQVEAQATPEPGGLVGVQFAASDCSLFDPQNQERL